MSVRPPRQCRRSARPVARFVPAPWLVCNYRLQSLELGEHPKVCTLSPPEGFGKGFNSPDNVALDYIELLNSETRSGLRLARNEYSVGLPCGIFIQGSYL